MICYKLTITGLIWLFISLTLLSFPAFSLNKDDWAIYNVKTYWFSNVPGESPPMDLLYLNETTWRLQVQDVAEERIKISVEKQLKNGTSVDVLEGDLESGGNLSLWIIRRNLNVGDSVYLNSEFKVNKTGFYNFAGANRDCAYGWFTRESGQVREEHAFFWDRETGVLCGSIASYAYVEDSNASSVSIYTNIMETNLWSPESEGPYSFDSWWLGVAFGVIFLVFACFLFLRERKKVRRRRLGRQYVSNRRLFRKTLIKVPLIYNC